MCVNSATAIANLLHLYELRNTFRRMNMQAVAITCSAALMLIFVTVLNRDFTDFHHDQETVAHLNLCFRALEEFGFSQESPKRAQSFLVSMHSLWETRIRPYRPAKRAMAEASEKSPVQSHQSKRSRVSPDSGDHRTAQEVHEEVDNSIDFDSEVFD